MDQSDRASRCPRCGAELSPDHEGLCPACLLAAGSTPLSHVSGDVPTMLPASGPEKGVRPLFSGGERFGPYRIERLLGRGGMGDVYEAEHLEQGRRVALKVLSQRLADPQDRARFLREGQLAASISHPHSVYIFGSEEIDGVPVIAMELLPGGTLKDRVASRGPLAPAAAVDAILQVIAGLDAAQAAGILHRDIKPSNCFIDNAGDVKVGDFGLSISTLARDVSQHTIRGTFHGTPQFAAPEQLRGEPLDVRADIYAVGATLYYLLTGRPPFDERDLMALIARIATEPPPSPRAIVPAIPRTLAAIVVRCLAKGRAQRPASYATLDDELRPFGSAAPTPATLGLRFLAGCIDNLILSVPTFPLAMSWMSFTLGQYTRTTLVWFMLAKIATSLVYFGILEGYWGASVGKWICRLRVTGPSGQRPGPARAMARALVYETPGMVGALPSLILGPGRIFQLAMNPRLAWLSGAPYYVAFAALFSSARRRNGFAGLHELASSTRVIERAKRGEARVAIELTGATEVATGSDRRYGPFDLVGALGATDRGQLLLGFDPSLRRNVWIHVLPSGTPAVAPLLRDVSRPGRLRWLSGQRAAGDAWDAYEALDGAPLAALVDRPRRSRPWRSVRYWLLDLAREIDAGLRDGSLPRLTFDRVWITHDGRAKLLDFTPPGATHSTEPERAPTFADAQMFLGDLARRGLGGFAPLPLSTEQMLFRLDNRAFVDQGELVAGLAGLVNRADRVEPWRRAIQIGLCAAPPVFLTLVVVVIMPLVMRHVLPKDAMQLSMCLAELSTIHADASDASAHEREILEKYVAGRFGPLLATDSPNPPSPILAGLLGPHRAEIDRVRAVYPHVSPEETAKAAAELGSSSKMCVEEPDSKPAAPGLFMMSTIYSLMAAVLGVLSAWIFRGGWLLRALGIAVVVKSGEEASRLRTLWRGLVAWSPVPALFYVSMHNDVMFLEFWPEVHKHSFTVTAVFVLSVVFVVGAVYAVLNPERGWQDRLAGTWLVPR